MFKLDLESKGIKVFFWRLPRQTLEGRVFTRMGPEDPSDFKPLCKEVITSLVFENLKRVEEGLPIIPLFFLIKKNSEEHGSKRFSTDFMALTQRVPKDKKRITDCELRRCYKLCTFPDKRVSNIAKATINFVSLKCIRGTWFVKRKNPFWEKSDWRRAWAQRSTKDTMTKPWALLLKREIEAYEAQKSRSK